MQWPEKPTCHGDVSCFGLTRWREPVIVPRDRVTPFRTCSYCGSIHPQDFYEAFKDLEPPPPRSDPDFSKLDPESPTLAQDHRALLDAQVALERVPRVGGSDWKYGWPHKFYVDFPVPAEMQAIERYGGGKSWTDSEGVRREEKYTAPVGPLAFAKWYNEHLLDEGYDDEAWGLFRNFLEKWSGIYFFKGPDGDLRYKAPRRGYQR